MDIDQEPASGHSSQIFNTVIPQDFSVQYRFATVKGYEVGEEIGGGGFSRVYRAYNAQAPRHRVVACKLVSIAEPNPSSSSTSFGADLKEIQKEVQVHRILKHKYVLEFLDSQLVGRGERVEALRSGGQMGRHGNAEVRWELTPGLYMLLEYAMGGDLFDKIAPDYGVDEDTARYYFAQLISGLEYIHERGICHRDLKPENLLLSADGELKISDFGLCAVWKHKGQVRKLSGRCGSLPYVAPELNRPGSYHAEPVDMWGAGVVLFTLLVGNTPWDEPSETSPEFAAYLTGEILDHAPWDRIQGEARDLLLGLLRVEVKDRSTLKVVQSHTWFLTQSQLRARDIADRLTDGLRRSGMAQIAEAAPMASQAMRLRQQGSGGQSQFSQFTQMPSQFMRATGMTSTSGGSTVVSPLTRFRLNLNYADAIEKLQAVLLSVLQPEQLTPTHEEGTILLSCMDRRRQLLRGTLTVRSDDVYEDVTLVELQRRVGDPIEWRRFWWKLVRSGDLEDYLVK